MNKTELVSSIAKETGLSKTKTNEVVDAFVSAVSESLSNQLEEPFC